MFTKDFSAAVKAAGTEDGLGDGQVKMLVSVFDNVDSYGDVVMPGAFTDTLAGWKDRGDPIPFIWSHQWSDPFSHIGVVTDAEETKAGLEVAAQIDLDSATGKQVFGLLKGRRVTQASFGYSIDEADWVERKADDGGSYEVYELRKVTLFECGPCLVGANQETELLEAKAAALHGYVPGPAELARLKHVRDAVDASIRLGEAQFQKTSGHRPEETGTSGQPKTRETSPVDRSAQARARLTLIASEN